MIKELALIRHTIFDRLELHITDLTKEAECEEYAGYNFKFGPFSIKFRKARITPKKTGQFVTLWKRNPQTKETEPFTSADTFDFLIIFTEDKYQQDFFFFSRNTLVQHKILTASSQTGKRGFRVYAAWDTPGNKQAEKTGIWQKKSFINFSDSDGPEQCKAIPETKT